MARRKMGGAGLVGVALLLGVSAVAADLEYVFISEFTIPVATVFRAEGELALDPRVGLPESEGWFETQVLWLYLATNRGVIVTAVGLPYTHVELDIALPTEAHGAYGRQTDARLRPFGWIALEARGVFNVDVPGRYVAWIALRVLRSGYNDPAGRYRAALRIILSP